MYKVICIYDGTTYVLHDPESEVLRIYDDELVTESNSPASFKFSVAYDHPYLDKIVGLSSDIRVYDDGEEIFRGRPIDDGEDLYRTRTFQCEGELAFLYDSIQPRRELHDITPLEFFTLLVEEHNAQVEGQGPIDKTFEVGNVTVTDSNNSLYRYTNRETTLDDILEKIVDRLGGHLSVRISGSTRYLDLLADVETVGDQPVQLGENLLTYAKNTDYTEIATACIPLGASQEETEIAALDAYLTVADVNDGSEVIQLSDAVDRYGFICKVLNYDDMTVASNLKTAGEEWLQDGQYASMTLSLTAVDLHNLGYDMQPIRTDTQVRVVSEPHGMNRYFEVTARTYHLTQPEQDTVTFGTTEKKTYTSSAKSSVSAVASHSEQVRQNIDSVIEKERDNISDILNQATHGYVVLDPNDGPERILIMDTDDVDTAQKIWKWDMNGLGYSSSGIDGPWGTAITMNGQISADFILTGTLYAGLIKTGILSDVKGNSYWNMETGELALSATATVGGSTVASIAADAAEEAADEAAKTATNFLSFDSTSGLQIGNKISGEWNGTRAQITGTAYNILDSDGTTLASFGSSSVTIGAGGSTIQAGINQDEEIFTNINSEIVTVTSKKRIILTADEDILFNGEASFGDAVVLSSTLDVSGTVFVRDSLTTTGNIFSGESEGTEARTGAISEQGSVYVLSKVDTGMGVYAYTTDTTYSKWLVYMNSSGEIRSADAGILIGSKNYTTYFNPNNYATVTALDAAKSSFAATYMPLSGGAFTGAVTSSNSITTSNNIYAEDTSTDNVRKVRVMNKLNTVELRASTEESGSGKAGLYHAEDVGFGTNGYLISISTSGTITTNTQSDRRLKNYLGNLSESEASALLENITPINFTYKGDSVEISSGFFAQDVLHVLKDYDIGYRSYLRINKRIQSDTGVDEVDIFDLDHSEDEVIYGLDYSKFVPILWKGWQMHKSEIDSLKEQNKQIRAQLESLALKTA